MRNLSVSPKAAKQLLAKRELARRRFVDYNRYVCIEGEEPQHHHIEVICKPLQAVMDGKIKRLMLFMPPGSAKSTYATVRFPAYYLSKTKRKGVITASYADTLAASFGRKVRNLVKSPEHIQLFNIALAEDSKAKGEWETDTGGFYYACGVGGSITGRRGDLGLIDDPVRSRKDADSETVRNATWEWYQSDFLTRLKPDAAQIIIQTRWHEDDLSGRLLPDDWAGESGEIRCKDGNDWTVISLPAQAGENDPIGRKPGDWLWPEWFTPDFWESIKESQSPRNWSSLYQQVPAADDGDLFKREWFNQRYTRLPSELNYYLSGDYAVSDKQDADYTCMIVWGVDSSGICYLVDWWVGKDTHLVYIEQLIRFIKQYKPAWHVSEQGVIRQAIEPVIKRQMREQNSYTTLKWTSSQGDKVAKSRSFQALSQQGVIRLPENLRDGQIILDQLVKFPAGRHDDCVDACSEFGRAITKAWEAKAPTPKDKRPPVPKGMIRAERTW